MITKILILLLIFSSPVYAQPHTIETNEFTVHFEESLRIPANDIAPTYARLKSDLEKIFGWKLNFKTTIVLIKENKTFQGMAGNDLFAAFAIPQKYLIVIDYSKMNTHPFTLAITLKHELCHLLLHHHIRTAHLPRWFDEGIAQWASDGISELIINKKTVIDEAMLSGNLIPMNALNYSFPNDRNSLMLAYEQSKRFVEYIRNEFGEAGISDMLRYLKAGDDINTAIRKIFSVSLNKLERQWHEQLRKKITWFVYVSIHIYEILFFLAALTTIYGFIRLVIRKRNYKDEDENG